MYDIEQIRALIQAEAYYIYDHLINEFNKEGLPVDQVEAIVLNGKIVEEYPDRQRVLVAGVTFARIPVHIVCDLSIEGTLQLVTGYIPDSQQWFGTQQRKPRRKGKP